MKTQHFIKNDIDIEYIFLASKSNSNKLIISFPGAALEKMGGDWGFLFTISKFDINILLLKSKSSLTNSLFLYKNKNNNIELAVKSLIDKFIETCNATDIICIGSSAGGLAALLYGLKYNFHIISGSPPYSCDDPITAESTTGSSDKKSYDWINNKIYSFIPHAHEHKFDKKIFILYGSGEYYYTRELQGKKLLHDLDDYNIKYYLKLCPFSEHVNVTHNVFPKYLIVWLNYLLGIADNIDDEYITKSFCDNSTKIVENILKINNKFIDILNGVIFNKVNLGILNTEHYSDINNDFALRNYLYIKEGYYFEEGINKPIKMYGLDSFWSRQAKLVNISLDYQDSMIRFLESNFNAGMLSWCSENIKEYIEYIRIFVNKNHTKQWLDFPRWYATLSRIHTLISFHCLLNKYNYNLNWSFKIPIAVKEDLYYLLTLKHDIDNYIADEYLVILALLHVSIYYKSIKNNNDFFETLYNTLYYITNYLFNKDGCCKKSLRFQVIISHRLFKIFTFIEKNNIIKTDILRKIEKIYKKIMIFCSHILDPNLNLIPLGETIPQKSGMNGSLTWSSNWIERNKNNCILKDSNIAILEDNTLSYITVNAPVNEVPSLRHCDLLSFTWYYNNINIFCDAGGLSHSLCDYLCSSIAHNSFFCDDKNYLIPDYTDFTSIEYTKENDDYVIIGMRNCLIEGVTLYRNFIWIKPNIILLLDVGTSNDEHIYNQNFLLNNFKILSETENQIFLEIDKDTSLKITQYYHTNEIVVRKYFGTNNIDNKPEFRGSLLCAWETLKKGINIVFDKKSSKAIFLTAIECNSNLSNLNRNENSIDNILFDNNKITVQLNTNKVFYFDETDIHPINTNSIPEYS